MIKVRAILAQADISCGGHILPEETCKELVKKFNESGKKLPIQLDKSPIVIGILKELSYDETTKLVYANIELLVDFAIGGTVLQKLETPEGTRVLDFRLDSIRMMFLQGGK